jgi:hypothetical protein
MAGKEGQVQQQEQQHAEDRYDLQNIAELFKFLFVVIWK